MDKINHYYIKPIIPWLFIIGGICILLIGNFLLDETYGNVCVSIGTSVLSGGVFAVILKTIQFLGVFKEELNSVIFEAKFLKNRVDLPIFWEKVTKEFIKDRFSRIHGKIFNDVKNEYLPFSIVQYYENYSHIINVEMIDPDKEIVKVNNKISFTINMADDQKEFPLPYKSSLICPQGCPYTTCVVKSVKLNDSDVKFNVKESYSGGSLVTEFTLKLNNKQKGYKIQFEVDKTYSLKQDNIIGYRSTFIVNKMKFQLFLKGVKGTFIGSGNLRPFKENHTRENFIEREYEDLLYKGQGFYVILNK